MTIELINKDGIVVMQIRFYRRIYIVTKEQRLVVEVDLDVQFFSFGFFTFAA